MNTPRDNLGSAPQIEGYEVFELIGRGGVSSVYMAEQVSTKRRVAVKVLDAIPNEADRGSIPNELQAFARLSTHPNIVALFHAVFSFDGRLCLVMPFVGRSLQDRLDRHGPESEANAVQLGVAIASALDAAHGQGVLHGDVKPHNILIDDSGCPQLADFSAATAVDDQAEGNAVSFTLDYVPPEILEGESKSTATDIYSLAATLYAALAGRRPFDEFPPQTPSQTARRILLAEPPGLETFGVSGLVSDVIHSGLSKRPSDRPSTAKGFEQELRNAATQLGITIAGRLSNPEKGHLPEIEPRSESPTIPRDRLSETTYASGTFRRVSDLVPRVGRTPDEESSENLSRTIEPLLTAVTRSLESGVWANAPETEHDVQATLQFLSHELRPPTGRPVDRVQVERLSLRLMREVAATETSDASSEAAGLIDSVLDFRGDEHDGEMALRLADELSRQLAAEQMTRPPDLDDTLSWEDLVRFVDEEPATATAMSLGWLGPNQLWSRLMESTRADLAGVVLSSVGAVAAGLASGGLAVGGIAGGILYAIWSLVRANFRATEPQPVESGD